MITNTEQFKEELLWALKACLEWIDAIPEEVELPAMPGFDRDWVESVIDNCERKDNTK